MQTTTTFRDWSRQYIGGQWKIGNSENTYLNKNPFDKSILVKMPLANLEDVNTAYQEAKAAQKKWQETSAYERSALLKKAAELLANKRDEIVGILVSETGSSFAKAQAEVDLSIADLTEFASLPIRMTTETVPSVVPGKENRIYRLPVGVVGVISPFNFPLYLSIRAIAPALAVGNGVVVKPDLQTFISGGLFIGKLFEEAGLPKGLLNIVVADIAEIGDAFVEHPVPKVISFTGSTAVGRHIAQLCAKNLKRVALELGGNNVMIVLDDADVEQAASAAVFGKFLHQGQICMSLNRIIVHRNLYDEFVKVFSEKVAGLRVGNPVDPNVFIGPIINQNQVDKIQQLIDQSIEQGANVVTRGNVTGTLMEPVILTDVTNDMAIAQNEIFGPVAAILPVSSEEEAIRIANDSDYGLSGSVFSGNLDHGINVALQIETGMIHVNDQSINCESIIPFGGEKSSGLGRYGGDWSLEEFTTLRWVSVQREPRPFPF
ncbi:aldehyde dehydrogenase family protein [Halalkalibacter krulwichiae]|uniref:3-sulfolactaldehyde dehydrogenase n=1 Tax=Halalkalibacter krulwichiae TaxID=199441 RepID=A0A1X9MFS1_9BACI|nr:aldehyde dehydrogenase family protein [Halalkalibacter krulwichiae]ARK32307.1 Putative aldehyde dehydrogenase YfmT [Halalkalibacter krulwichiae]